MTSTTIVTTCKSRVEHLEIACASWLYVTPCPILIVADGCPELGVPDMSLSNWDPDQRVRVVRTEAAHTDPFSKPRALNLGASLALTEHLLFLDADTLLMSGFWAWYSRRVAADALFIVPPSVEARDLTGVLGVPRADYLAVQGADPGFVGWGAEDLDLRLRLYLVRALRVVELPTALLASLPHDDALRTRHYAEPDKQLSYERNMARLVANAERLSGQSIGSLLQNPDVHRLFMSAPSSGVTPR